MSALVAGVTSPGRGPLLLGAAATLPVIALWPSVDSLLANWREIQDYRHGYLIAAASIVWLFMTIRNHAAHKPGFSATATFLLALCLFTWVVAFRANSIIAYQLLLVPALWLSVVAVGGWQFARPALAPIAFLLFAIPVWEFLLPLLQRLCVVVTEASLSAAGVPAEISEYSVRIPSGTFEIVEGCSGKRYFVVALAFAVIAGVVQGLRGLRMAALIVAAGSLALVANWLRIFVVIVAGHLTNMQHYLVAQEHESFGNVVFVLLLAGVYVLSRRFTPAVSDKAAIKPGRHATEYGTAAGLAQGTPFVLLLATLAVTHVAGAAVSVDQRQLDALPFLAGSWDGPLPPTPEWFPRYVQPGSEVRAAYRSRGGGTVEIYVNRYETQQPGRELVFHENSVLAPGSWTRNWPLATSQLAFDSAPGLTMLQARTASGQAWQLAYVYKVGRWETTNAAVAQAAYGLQSILRPAPAGIIALGVQCRDNCQEAQELVRSFWRELSGPILESISDHES